MPPRLNVTLSGCICRNPNCQIPYGLCHCGCGEKTKISKYNITLIGWVAGMPTRYIMGHANRKLRIDFSDAMPFKIKGIYCKLLSLGDGMFAIIDASDYEWLSQFYWYALWAKGSGFYVVRHAPTKKKVTGRHIYLHRFILGLEDDDERIGDHRNGCTLDHRRKNLRPLPPKLSNCNQKMHCNNTSGREGVSFEKKRQMFTATMRREGKNRFLGRSKSFEVACAIREKAEEEYKGELIRRNQDRLQDEEDDDGNDKEDA